MDLTPREALTAKGEARCQSLTREGAQCANVAVKGRTRCKPHGGNGSGYPALTTSTMNPATRERLELNMERIRLLQTNPLDPVSSVAKSKALLDHAIESHLDPDTLEALFLLENAAREPEDGELVAFQAIKFRSLSRDKADSAAIEARVQQIVAIQDAFLSDVLPLIERMGERVLRSCDAVLGAPEHAHQRQRMLEALQTNLDLTREQVLIVYDRATK